MVVMILVKPARNWRVERGIQLRSHCGQFLFSQCPGHSGLCPREAGMYLTGHTICYIRTTRRMYWECSWVELRGHTNCIRASERCNKEYNLLYYGCHRESTRWEGVGRGQFLFSLRPFHSTWSSLSHLAGLVTYFVVELVAVVDFVWVCVYLCLWMRLLTL